MRIGVIICMTVMKHSIWRKRMLHTLSTLCCIKIELIFQVINVIFFFVSLNSCTACLNYPHNSVHFKENNKSKQVDSLFFCYLWDAWTWSCTEDRLEFLLCAHTHSKFCRLERHTHCKPQTAPHPQLAPHRLHICDIFVHLNAAAVSAARQKEKFH